MNQRSELLKRKHIGNFSDFKRKMIMRRILKPSNSPKKDYEK